MGNTQRPLRTLDRPAFVLLATCALGRGIPIETWNSQAGHRGALTLPDPTSNFMNAVAVTF